MNQQMMAQVRKMQAQMAKAQEEIEASVVTGSAGGAITVELTGDYKVRSVKITDKAALDPEDPETLEDAIVAAMNDALDKVRALTQEKMGAVAGGMRIPGLM